jgi:deazaflavin-dependent oxidoreductase (nitroreductase family)
VVRSALPNLAVNGEHQEMTENAMSPVREAARTFNKFVLNPAMLHVAGRKHWYAGIIRHTGRRSGKSYATPVVADRVTDGFIVPLPYGTGVDWLRNVLVAGAATLIVDDKTYDVAEPEIIDAAAALPQMSARRRRTFARFGIAKFVKLILAK